MDYRKYYVKNLLGDGERSKIKLNKYEYDAPPSRNASSVRKSANSPQIIQPKVIYLQAQATNVPQVKQEYDYEAVPVKDLRQQAQTFERKYAEKTEQKSKKHLTFKSFVIFFLVLSIGIMSSYVISDFITEGQVFKKMSENAALIKNSNYYAIIVQEFGTYDDAQNFSLNLRNQGAGGYIIKEGQKFCVIGDVFENEKTAQKVCDKQQSARLAVIELPEIKFKKLVKPYDKKLEKFLEYSLSAVGVIDEIIPQITNLEITEKEAMQKIYAEYLHVKSISEEFDIFAKKNVATFSLSVASDIQVTLGLLDNLCNDKLTRPNLVCDLRYYKMQILINFQNLLCTINNSIVK